MTSKLLVATVALLAAGASLAEQAPTPSPPPAPCASADHRAFDFWIGTWSVRNTGAPSDRPPATNRITSVQGGCVIREDYTTPGGYSGTSLSFYDRTRGVWHQTWIDNQGQPLYLEGGMRGESMVLGAKNAGGTDRVTWTPLSGGRVRQLWERSADDGKVWKTVFDGIYTPREGGE